MTIETHNPVRLMTLSEQVHKEMPGVTLRETVMGDTELVLYLSSHSSGSVAYNQEMAESLMTALIERLRLEAIHQLGLEPRLNAWRDQVNTYRDENRDMRAQVVQLLSIRDNLLIHIEKLEATLDKEDETDE